MKQHLHYIVLFLSMFIISSCSKDDDNDSFINSITIDGTSYRLNGGYIEPAHELDEDLNWHYAEDVTIFGGGIVFNEQERRFEGEGFVMIFRLHSSAFDLEKGLYNFSEDNSALSFNQCAYVTDFDIDSTENLIDGIVVGGTIDISWSDTHTIIFEMKDDTGKEITGHFEHRMLFTE